MKEAHGSIMTGCDHELLSMAKGRRIILVRHGQVRQNKEKILLGQTDVPLSDKGKIQAGRAGEQLAELGPETDRIYSSPLIRAKETAEIIAGSLGAADTAERSARSADTAEKGTKSSNGEYPGSKVRIVPVDDLAEISLGDWDGKYISEIKEKYPERFEARGENLFSFDIGGGSENFYDLQTRVVNALKEILNSDPAKDIVIVSHKGVIRALENKLSGKSVDEPWDAPDTGDIRIIKR